MSFIERQEWKGTPEESCFIVYQIIRAVQHLHQQQITHRDIKPENILMESTASYTRVVLTDFGSAIRATAGAGQSHRMETITGTAHYLAPEVYENRKFGRQPGYTQAVDMWSIGCVTSALLTGGSAFAITQAYHSNGRQDSTEALKEAAARCDLSDLDTKEIWLNVSAPAKTFIRSLIVLDERERLSAEKALGHEWFTEDGRRERFPQLYNRVISLWRPRTPGWDFSEKLDSFIDARIPGDDVRTL